jgi:hypothetical protein
LAVGTEAKPRPIPEGGRLTVRAVEWSGLKSGHSNALVIEAGMTVVSGHESTAQAPALKPEVVKKDGVVVERRYLSPQGWPCQVLQYRLDGSLERRRLFRGPDRLFSEEDYAPTGRRIKETIHNREGEVWQWTRFEAGLAVERWHLQYGLYPLHKELKAGRWIRVQP